jgi:DNA-binding transcriptional MerR regulator
MEKNVQIFTTMQAARIVGVSYARLDSWDRRGGFFKPMIEAEGRGSLRYYSFMDLVQLGAIKSLRDQGASLQSLRKAKRVMSKLDIEKPWQYIICEGGDLYVETEKAHVLSLLSQPGQGVMQFQIVHLIEVVIDIRLGIEVENFRRTLEREQAWGEVSA